MPELRHDPLTGVVVIVAPERSSRRRSADHALPQAGDAARCPFCPGHEHETPPEVARTGPGDPDTTGWRVRVVPNKYPIVGGGPPAGKSVTAPATGAHEVVVLSPAHEVSFAGLADDQVVEVFGVLRDRAARHLDAGRSFVQVLVNHGASAGASIAHPHAQVVALDLVPPAVADVDARIRAAGVDLVATAMARAEAEGHALHAGPAVAWCPPASGAPYETWVAHRSARARFDEAGDDELAAVAVTARDVLASLSELCGDVAYNLVVHTAPRGGSVAGSWHWWVQVVPRTSVVAGFELGTGILVNTVAPEHAALALRGARDGWGPR